MVILHFSQHTACCRWFPFLLKQHFLWAGCTALCTHTHTPCTAFSTSRCICIWFPGRILSPAGKLFAFFPSFHQLLEGNPRFGIYPVFASCLNNRQHFPGSRLKLSQFSFPTWQTKAKDVFSFPELFPTSFISGGYKMGSWVLPGTMALTCLPHRASVPFDLVASPWSGDVFACVWEASFGRQPSSITITATTDISFHINLSDWQFHISPFQLLFILPDCSVLSGGIDFYLPCFYTHQQVLLSPFCFLFAHTTFYFTHMHSVHSFAPVMWVLL